MTLFGLFGVLSVALVVGQLASVQHAALMTFYNETGAVVKREKCFLLTRRRRLRLGDVPSLRNEPVV